MGDVNAFLSAIPAAAKSPYALIAYITSALLFITSISQRRQIKPVLKIIDKVPKEDRKGVIEATLNTKLPKNISGEQYLRREKMKYIFLAFMGLLALVGGITTIALVSLAGPHPSRNAQIRVQLWPRPEIKQKFLRDHDARLYLKTDKLQLDLTKFVPTQDFLDDIENIDETLMGKVVDLTISPREKYVIGEDRRYLTPVIRIEVYPLGKKPVPEITTNFSPSGEDVFRTTGLPFSSDVGVVKANMSPQITKFINVIADRAYILDLQGVDLTTNTKLDIVDEKGKPVIGAWAGNELGTSNGKPAEVSVSGDSLKTYFAVPSAASGHRLFWRIQDPSNQVNKEIPLIVLAANAGTGG